MTADAIQFTNEIGFRATKCRQHLARAQLALVLSEAAATPERLAAHQALVRTATGPTDDPVARVAQALTRSLFLDLKVNFELFLWTGCRAWLTHDLIGAMRRIADAKKKNKTLKEFLKKKLIADFFENVEDFIPAHGLELLMQMLDAMTPGGGVHAGSFWPQIRVAFAVRHLLEHRNGRVDAAFIGDVAPWWKDSSWGLSGERPGERVQVTAADFAATYVAMDRGVEEIAGVVNRAWPTR